MANVIFNKCIAELPEFPTPKDKYDSLVPHDPGTFYLVGEELYLGDGNLLLLLIMVLCLVR